MKTYIKITAVCLLLVVTLFGIKVFAEDNNQGMMGHGPDMFGDASITPPMPHGDQGDNGKDMGLGPMNGQTNLNITPSKQVMLQGGKVTAVNGSNLTLSVFGLSVSVDASSANVVGNQSLSNVKVGDNVSIKGTINDSTGLITAQSLRDDSQGQTQVNAIQARIQELLNEIKKLQGQLGQSGSTTTPSH